MLLTGVRVLDLSRLLPGGYCTKRLLELGADILKIEPPRGDPLRRLPGGQIYFEALHRGKRLVTINLGTDVGRRQLEQEVGAADVLVEGFRPGVLERRGVGYAALARINPGLIYCAITGYGSSGALARRAGHDLNYLARSGVLSLMPQADGVPVIPGIQVADLAGGLEAAFLIASALMERQRTGKGQRLEVSMADLMLSWTALPRAVRRAGLPGLPLTGELPSYHVYRVPDGFLTVAALEPEFWRTFCRAVGRDDLVERQFDPAAVADVQTTLEGLGRQAWMARLGDRDVCVEPALRLDELAGD
jgi:alpha-methylacyl-CoA racemase